MARCSQCGSVNDMGLVLLFKYFFQGNLWNAMQVDNSIKQKQIDCIYRLNGRKISTN